MNLDIVHCDLNWKWIELSFWLHVQTYFYMVCRPSNIFSAQGPPFPKVDEGDKCWTLSQILHCWVHLIYTWKWSRCYTAYSRGGHLRTNQTDPFSQLPEKRLAHNTTTNALHSVLTYPCSIFSNEAEGSDQILHVYID